ncbi:hypothetical protein [Rhizobium rhizosphaerae]|uniref:hypothetical protein n=1 Tax=Xaviernesmea rhizosphaerae TaxID=1672749 RepID=UPI00111B56F4|nr:hypothetical protein [Xaviernesmea rhizosphaerae]
MSSLEEAVKAQLGSLAFALCEANVRISMREARLAEVEAELASLQPEAKAAPAFEVHDAD